LSQIGAPRARLGNIDANIDHRTPMTPRRTIMSIARRQSVTMLRSNPLRRGAQPRYPRDPSHASYAMAQHDAFHRSSPSFLIGKVDPRVERGVS
jgi:hypothetical protein